MVLCDRFVTLARQRIQQDRSSHSAPLLFGSRRTDGLQFVLFRFGELQGAPLPREGHASLKHNHAKMYSYLQNDNLVFVWQRFPGMPAPFSERIFVARQNYLEWQRQNTVFQEMGAFHTASLDENSG